MKEYILKVNTGKGVGYKKCGPSDCYIYCHKLTLGCEILRGRSQQEDESLKEPASGNQNANGLHEPPR